MSILAAILIPKHLLKSPVFQPDASPTPDEYVQPCYPRQARVIEFSNHVFNHVFGYSLTSCIPSRVSLGIPQASCSTHPLVSYCPTDFSFLEYLD